MVKIEEINIFILKYVKIKIKIILFIILILLGLLINQVYLFMEIVMEKYIINIIKVKKTMKINFILEHYSLIIIVF